MDMRIMALRIATSGTWFHVTRRDLLDSVIKGGLQKSWDESKWGGLKTGDGVYLIDSMYGAKEYRVILELMEEDAVIFEVSISDSLLMDEDRVTGGDVASGPSYEFKEDYPEAAAEMERLIEEGSPPNDAVISVIDSMTLPPDPRFMDAGQGGVNALTARYPGNIPSSSIVRAYVLFDDDPYIIWPPDQAQDVPSWEED